MPIEYDRVFYFDEEPRASQKLVAKSFPKAQKSQTTLAVTGVREREMLSSSDQDFN
jgi:hypothetical protein